MKVQSVQNNYNDHQKQSFNGYVDKSLKGYVNSVVKTECEKLVTNANRDKTEVDSDILQGIYNQGKRILNRFNIFVEPQHKDTAIKLNEAGIMTLTNPITKKDIPVHESSIPLSRGWFNYGKNPYIAVISKPRVDLKNPQKIDLDKLENIANHLLSDISTTEVDKTFLSLAEEELKRNAIYKNGTGIIGRFKTKRQAGRVSKFARDIGAQTESENDAKVYHQYINDAKKREQDAESLEKYSKEIEMKNNKILKDVLDGKKDTKQS